MKPSQSLISGVDPTPSPLCDNTTTVLEQLKIMFTAIAKVGRQDFFPIQTGNQPRLLGMTFLFAAVMLALSFFGHSIDCSVASTSTISITVSLGCRVFFPRKIKLFGFDQHIFNFLHRATYRCFTDSIGQPDMKFSPTFTSAHQGQHQLVCPAQIWPLAKVTQSGFNSFQHLFKHAVLNPRRPFEFSCFNS